MNSKGILLLVLSSLLTVFFPKKTEASEPIYMYPLTPAGDSSIYLRNQSRLFFDDDGILKFNYSTGPQVNPMFMATYLLTLIDDNLVNPSDENEQIIATQVTWLNENLTVKTYNGLEFLTYPHPFENTHYHAPVGWTSSLTNSRLLALYSVLYRVYGDDVYLDKARLLFNSFLIHKDNGGVITTEEGLWFEEVADPSVASSKILNGHIGSIMGVWTYYKNIPTGIVKKYLDRATETTQVYLPDFDAGFTSYYDHESEPRRFAALHGYHHQHIRQVEWLQCYSEDFSFSEHSTLFNKYEGYYYQIIDKSSETDVSDRLHYTAGEFIELDSAREFDIEFPEPVSLKGYSLVQHPSYDVVDYGYQLKFYDVNNQQLLSLNNEVAQEYYYQKALEQLTGVSRIEVNISPEKSGMHLAGIKFASDDYPSASSDWWMRNSANNSNKIFFDGFKTSRNGFVVLNMAKYQNNQNIKFTYTLPDEQTISPRLSFACFDDFSEVSSENLTVFDVLKEETTYTFTGVTESCPILYMQYRSFGTHGLLEYVDEG